jgi:hypothetical protein
MDPVDPAEEKARAAARQASRGDVPAAPTTPMPAATETAPASPPRVGLNWRVVATRLGIRSEALQQVGIIVLAGEYFPEGGFVLDPETLRARWVDVGDVALRHGYFLGDLAIRDYQLNLDIVTPPPLKGVPIVPVTRGPIIAVFAGRVEAERAKRRILAGSLGSGLRIEDGPLGPELHVQQPELPGRVATTIAADGGAVISVGGRPVADMAGQGAMATGLALGEGDRPRGGTGATGDSSAPNPPPPTPAE